MCFSATASFTAGTILTTVGLITLKQSPKKTKLFSAIPLLFGVQQLLEGFVWLSLMYSLPILNTFATYGFVFFSHLLWPIYTPLSVALMEPTKWRKRLIITCVVIGVVVSGYSLLSIILSPIRSQITCDSIHYNFSSFIQTPLSINVMLYFIATCFGCLLSSHRLVKLFGVSVVAFLMLSFHYYTTTFVSVWCFFSAILSIIIYFFIKQQSSTWSIFKNKFRF